MDKLSILIVEDQDNKYEDVRKKLLERFHQESLPEPGISRAASHTGAVLALGENKHFDIIVLDLKIPFVDNDDMPSFDASKAFLHYLRSNPTAQPFRVLALTSFEENELPDLQSTDSTVTVQQYKAMDDSWLDRLIEELRYISKAKTALMRYYNSTYDLDVLIVVARFENEFAPINEAIEWLAPPTSDARLGKRMNLFGKVSYGSATRRVGLICIQETGLSTSAALVGNVIAFLRPKTLLMLGMCCGLNDLSSPRKSLLGDVIVADETACWDEGKYSEELVRDDPFYNRSVVRTPEHSFRNHLKAYFETNGLALDSALLSATKPFKKSVAKCDEPVAANPTVHCGLMLSGSSVVDSVRQIATIRSRFPSAIGLEMEAHSVYAAVDATVGPKPSAVVIKGVADHGQGKKNKQAQKWASTLSYVVAREYLVWDDHQSKELC